jgi:UDP-N-acetylglucosamine--N-acetylmuramyl-(pentapeptide) pyrophosphoryl-undecaprenol N-acetylglucosamine transferase
MEPKGYGDLRVVVTGGGSGGHTSAAVGIIEAIVERGGDRRNILWIGSREGVERKVAERAEVSFEPIPVGKFRRYWSLDNLLDIPRVIAGVLRSLKLVFSYSPSVVVSTGGFVSVPVVLASYLLRKPVIVHEQTIIPGLANRVAGRLASKIIVTQKESSRHFDERKVIVVGNPLRAELRKGLPGRAEALARLGLEPGTPVLYVTGGAQGANALNQVIAESLPELLQGWQVTHQCGTLPMEYGLDALKERAALLAPELSGRYRVMPYVGPEIVDVFSVADVMLSRSGAATINEIIRLGLVAILVPYPSSAGNEQKLLASILEKEGAAVMIEQQSLTKESFLGALSSLDEGRRAAVKERALGLAPERVEEQLAQVILETAAAGG